MPIFNPLKHNFMYKKMNQVVVHLNPRDVPVSESFIHTAHLDSIAIHPPTPRNDHTKATGE